MGEMACDSQCEEEAQLVRPMDQIIRLIMTPLASGVTFGEPLLPFVFSFIPF